MRKEGEEVEEGRRGGKGCGRKERRKCYRRKKRRRRRKRAGEGVVTFGETRTQSVPLCLNRPKSSSCGDRPKELKPSRSNGA